MHGWGTHGSAEGAPQTTGLTLHGAFSYDVLTRMLGLGVRGRNSRMVVELAQVKPGEAVLDVACGTGNLTLAAAAVAGAAGRVHGIDASPEMIARAQKKAARAGSGVVFHLGLAEQLPFPDGDFDVVISRLAIHHLPEDLKARAFAEMWRVLRPGGRVLIADFSPPANRFLWHAKALMFGPRMMRNDIARLSPMLVAAGFVEVTSGPTRSALLGFVRGEKAGAA